MGEGKPLLPKTRKQTAPSALAIDFTQDREVVRVLPCAPLLSSHPGQWNGVHLSYYQHPPHEIPEVACARHLVLIHLEIPTRVEQWLGTRFQKNYFQVGSVLVVPANVPHRANWDTENRYLLLSLDPIAFLNTVQSAGERQTSELIPHFSAADPLVYGIGLSLKGELESGNLGGRLYADSLCSALFAHLLHHYTSEQPPRQTRDGGLPRARLRRVIEYVDVYLDRDLTLTELAAIAQLSPNYFTRSFKQSTGFTPHQYVIRQRVEKAKQLLVEGQLAIADIALEVGFAHQSHLNRHFKRWVGVTPKAFIRER